MFKLNFKIAIRNIWRNKMTTAIKLFGLIVGLSSVAMLVVYVLFEMSYDQHNENAKQIYRVHAVNTKDLTESIRLPSGLTDMMIQEIPEIKSDVELSGYESQVKVGGRIYTQKIINAEHSFFEIFTVPLIIGDRKTVLAEPATAVISERFAKTLMSGGNPIGQGIYFNREKKPYKVVGVMKDLPMSTHIHGDILIHESKHQKLNWRAYNAIPQYVLLEKNSRPETVLRKLGKLYKKYEFPKHTVLTLMPLTNIHLHSHTSEEIEPNSDIKYIYIFSAVALFILVIAIVNFINLTVAASLKRGKEIGIKKVMGASRHQLRIQFLSESYLYFIVALLFMMIIIFDIIPLVGLKLGITIGIKDILSAKTILFTFAIVLVSGFIAGFYPAIILSRLMPVQTLKGYAGHVSGKFSFKNFLIVFQFSSSALLIICTLIINSQLNFISNKNLGFDKDHVLFNDFNMFDQGFTSFKAELLAQKSIQNISLSAFNPGVNYGGSSTWADSQDSTKEHKFDFIYADLNFISTLNIQVVKGRAFSSKYGADIVDYAALAQGHSYEERIKIEAQSPIILNEAAVTELQLKNPIDTALSYGGLQGKIIGVVKDFNSMSLHNKVTPLAIVLNLKPDAGYTFIKFKATDVQATKKIIDKIWTKHFPNVEPDFKFLDQQIEQLYKSEMRLGSVFMSFASVAIFLCCMGLFGMVYFDLEQKTKEIAIRKVLGASIQSLLTLMNGGFMKLVVIANLLIWPLAYLLIRNWLDSFYYRIALTYLPFVVALGICLLLTLLTVSLQALKAIKKSPVNALKYE